MKNGHKKPSLRRGKARFFNLGLTKKAQPTEPLSC